MTTGLDTHGAGRSVRGLWGGYAPLLRDREPLPNADEPPKRARSRDCNVSTFFRAAASRFYDACTAVSSDKVEDSIEASFTALSRSRLAFTMSEANWPWLMSVVPAMFAI